MFTVILEGAPTNEMSSYYQSFENLILFVCSLTYYLTNAASSSFVLPLPQCHTLYVLLLAENVPAELRNPFYCDQYEQEHLKPPVTRLLQASELYGRAYSLLLEGTGAKAQPKDYGDLLQRLSQEGIVPKDQNTPVTDADLRHKPIKMVKLWCLYCTDFIMLCEKEAVILRVPSHPMPREGSDPREVVEKHRLGSVVDIGACLCFDFRD